jgi:hypothetical protein
MCGVKIMMGQIIKRKRKVLMISKVLEIGQVTHGFKNRKIKKKSKK